MLPAEVLDNTELFDPETGLPQPSLRQCCSQDDQLCYAQVLHSFAEGLYWADVAATSDLADAERVILTETHLAYALAWDERLFWHKPTQIRRLMQTQAEELAPLAPSPDPEPAAEHFPAPPVPLTVMTTVEVTPEELRAVFEANEPPHLPDAPTRTGKRQPRNRSVQQGLLRALACALEELLEDVTDWHTAQVLHALSTLVRRVKRWQQQTRQRVVNAVCAWDAASNGLVWALTLGVPEVLFRAA